MEAGALGREHLAALVRRDRIALGMSVSAAAKAAGIDRATWTGIEDRTRLTRENNYAGIERALRWPKGRVDEIVRSDDSVPFTDGPGDRFEAIRQEANVLGKFLHSGQINNDEFAAALRSVRQAFVKALGPRSGRVAFLRLMDELSQPRSEADHNGQTDDDD